MRWKDIARFALLGLTTGCGEAAEAPEDAAPSVSDVAPVAGEAPPAPEAAPPELPGNAPGILLLDPADHPAGLHPAVSRAAPFWDQELPVERITVAP